MLVSALHPSNIHLPQRTTSEDLPASSEFANMAAVAIPSDDNSYFSRMPRSRSQPKFAARHSSFSAPNPPTRKPDDYASTNNPKIYPDSAPSSVASSPHMGDSDDLSYASTPPTDMSLDSDETMKEPIFPEDHFIIPHYAQSGFYDSVEDLEPPTSPKTGDSYTVSPDELDNDTSRPGTPTCLFDVDAPVQDDTAVKSQPTRHVDYLSHEWREEDIWSSWRYIVSRRSEVANSARLENASWRTWTKAKNNLQTVSPEALNWLKDCDVTWLYGPLQTGGNVLGSNSQSCKHMSKNGSFINKKPCLKKRSMSEVMLQKSLSASALVKTAAAAVQAQRVRPALSRAATDYTTFPFSFKGMSQDSCSMTESSCDSGTTSPAMERRHIHFNEQVEQCIALDVKGDDDDEEGDLDMDRFDDSDSDDDAVMMKRTRTKKRSALKRRRARKAPAIAKLPSTKLKYREDVADEEEPTETAMKHSVIRAEPIMSPSSSQETLCPPKSTISSSFSSNPSSGNFLFGDEDEEAEEAMLSPKRRFQLDEDDDDFDALHQNPSSLSCGLNAEPAGMHRTDSARDIAHVIWNVGWRQ